MKKGLAAFAGFELVKGIGEMVKSSVDAGSHINDLSQSAGVSAAALQELGYAAKLNSSDMDSMAGALGKLSRNMLAAKNGGDEQQKAFAALGVRVTDTHGKLRPTDEVLADIAEHFKGMPDGAEKTAEAMSVLGRSGAALIPTLNEGKDGLSNMRQEARDLGGVIDDLTVKQLDDLGDTADKVKFSLTGLKNTAIKALLPLLQSMATNMLEWVKANKEVIASTIKGAVEAVIVVAKGLAAAVGVLIDGFEFLKEHATLARAILLALGIAIGVVAAEAAIAWIVGFFPIIAVIAAITAVILIVEDLWKSITTGKGVAAAAWRWITRQAKEFWQGLKDIGNGIATFFTDLAHDIKQAFEDAFNWIENKALALGEGLAKLPVIKQLVEFGHYIAGGNGAGSVGATLAPDALGADHKSHGSTITFGDTNITMHIESATGDPQELADKFQQAIQEHHDKTMRDASAATGASDQ